VIKLVHLAASLLLTAACTRTPAPAPPAVSAFLAADAGMAPLAPDPTRETAFLFWLRKAPTNRFSDPGMSPDYPDTFSDAAWYDEGAKVPHVMEDLVTHLAREDLAHPSLDAARLAVALGVLGDRSAGVVAALVRALGTGDIHLRMEAAVALVQQGDATALPALQKLLGDPEEDLNVRLNACAAVAKIGPREPASRTALEVATRAAEPLLVQCAREALGR
jgi:HEAT repeats